MVDTTPIQRVIGTARRRLRVQAAFEWSAAASIALSLCALAVVPAARLTWISSATAALALMLAGAVLVLAAIVGAARPYTLNFIATKIDRQAGLCDRLASACAFERRLASQGSTGIDEKTLPLMHLAIADAARAVAQANPKAATPFRAPKRLKPAIACALFAGFVALLPLSREVPRPTLSQVNPAMGASGSLVLATGSLLLTPSGAADTLIFLGKGPSAIAVDVRPTKGGGVEFEVPANAPTGATSIRVRAGGIMTNPLPFEVLDTEDPRAIPEENIVMDEDDLDFVRDLVSELRKTSEHNQDLALEVLANELDKLLDQAEKGKVNKRELLEALNKAEEKYMEGSEDAVKESLADLKKAGKELQKDKLTKQLGSALAQGQLEKARAEMEKLAKLLEDSKLSDTQAAKLGKALEKAAAKMSKAEKQREKQAQKQQAKREESIRKLEKKRDRARTQQDREELVRRLDKEKRELRRLQRKQDKKERSASKRELKQLRRKMNQAAKALQKKQQGPPRQRSRRQVAKTMRDMARRTGKVSQDKRKMANKAKVITQMSDLKEAMRRAKRKGKKGAKNRFGRNGAKKRDFAARARGGKGQSGAWKPGQGGKGTNGKAGQGGKNGKGNQGDDFGDGHDPNVMGDPTKMSGDIEDQSLQGQRGKGPSTRETILTAAQKGFASRSYEDVFVKYKTIVEEVIKAEKVPSGYKHYVQRYFHEIKPER